MSIINTSVKSKCYRCDGKGYEEKKTKKCPTCKGTGKWIEDSYILVAQQPNGQKIAFSVDSAGK